MKIKTLKLQEMVSKAIKGAGNNKLIPITGLIGIEVKDNKLSLICTDATNYIKVSEVVTDVEDFYVTVSAELFSKLISKMTCETVNIEISDNALIIKGNGEYKIDIQLDEYGSIVKFPDKFNEYPLDIENDVYIKKETIDKVLNTNKAAIAVTMEIPCYTGYYFGKDIISTDTFKICATDINVFKEPCLISSQSMELLSVFDDEKISVYNLPNNVMVFTTPNIQVYTVQLDGIEDFAVDAINGLIDTEFESMCKFDKQSMINLLDRISLFISPYDNNNITMTFTDDGILVKSKKSNGSELIKYTEKENYKPFECVLSVEMLLSQIKAQPGEVVELWYGNDTAIKMTCEDVTQIVALSEKAD